MKALKWTALAVTVAGVAAVGLALAPSVHGQGRARELTVLAGRGGELGIRIVDAAAGGVEIERVEPDSAAEKAGMKAGDVILEFDGERVRSGRQFARLVQETPAGRTVKATISRNGQRQELQITTAEGRDSAVIFDGDRLRAHIDRFGDLDRLRDMPFNFNFDFDMPAFSSGRLGVTVEELTSQLGDYFGAKEGVLVTSVTDGSAAARAGLKAGDVIASVNGSRIRSREDLLRALRQTEAEELSIGIVRDKKESTVKARIELPRRSARGARPV